MNCLESKFKRISDIILRLSFINLLLLLVCECYSVLSNVTGNIVNIDDFKIHENEDGSVDKTKTDLYIHLVDREDNSIVEVAQVLRVIDKNIEKLDSIFKVIGKHDLFRL